MNPEATSPPARIVSFGGYDFDANRVLAVGPVSRRPLDGQYVMRVRLDGTTITILSPMRESSWANRKATPEECREAAERMREELLEAIWPGRALPKPTPEATSA
jgi:hypothetical protein